MILTIDAVVRAASAASVSVQLTNSVTVQQMAASGSPLERIAIIEIARRDATSYTAVARTIFIFANDKA